MNRVRKFYDKYQVLVTPHHRFDVGTELMFGNWTDPNLSNFYVETYDSWEGAMARAFKFPDINWDQMVLYHKDIYAKLYNIVKYEINVNNFDVSLKPILLNSQQAKNLMFNRVLKYGERFRLGYHMNDIISFRITNMYSQNLQELAEILSVNQELRITYKKNNLGSLHLVGKTDLGTSYEIVLSTDLISVWNNWAEKNYQIPEEIKLKRLENVLKQQATIDKSNVIR